MNTNMVELETVCGITSTLPINSLPEFAFVGRSNVGKSSLINSLLNRRSFARTSSQPGKTQTINYYKVGEQVYFVDLPGYGYAKVSAELRAKWGRMIERYLETSAQLTLIFLLVDIRHEPSANDKMMFEWITYHKLPVTVIATKADKLSKNQVAKQLTDMRKALGMRDTERLVAFSATSKQGKDEILQCMETYIK